MSRPTPSCSEASENQRKAQEGQNGQLRMSQDGSQQKHHARKESPEKDKAELDPVSLSCRTEC